jgi:uncharacterized membrane protein YbhN (UPF0104 family)
MKFGSIFRANYLKHHYGLAYAHFVTFYLYYTFLMTFMAAVIGLSVLLTFYGLVGYGIKTLVIVFVGAITGSLLCLLVPLPIPAGRGSLSTAMRKFLLGRSQISKERKTVLAVAALLAVNFLLVALRLGVIYHSMGKDIYPAGYLVLGALAYVILFIGLTPGSLGIRELVLSSSAVVLGVPLEVGILAAMVDRAVTVVYAFVVGGGCALWLWRKSPTDFRKLEVST